MVAATSDHDVGRSLIHAQRYEPHVTAVVRKLVRPGHTFLDLGANIGYFTLLAASLVGESGKVISVEPNLENLRLTWAARHGSCATSLRSRGRRATHCRRHPQ